MPYRDWRIERSFGESLQIPTEHAADFKGNAKADFEAVHRLQTLATLHVVSLLLEIFTGLHLCIAAVLRHNSLYS
jgi:hypothetical protein